MAKDSIKTVVTDLVEGVAVGGGSSFMISQIWTETIHTFFVIGAGVIGAIAVYFTNRLLRKYFPDENK